MSKKDLNNLIVEKEVFDFDIITAHIRQIFMKRDFNFDAFKYQINIALDQLTTDFWRRIVGKEQKKTIIFFTPATWKDHFKKKHRNKRWMKRWLRSHPIKAKKISFDINKVTVFPEVKVPHDLKEFEKLFQYVETTKRYES